MLRDIQRFLKAHEVTCFVKKNGWRRRRQTRVLRYFIFAHWTQQQHTGLWLHPQSLLKWNLACTFTFISLSYLIPLLFLSPILTFFSHFSLFLPFFVPFFIPSFISTFISSFSHSLSFFYTFYLPFSHLSSLFSFINFFFLFSFIFLLFHSTFLSSRPSFDVV